MLHNLLRVLTREQLPAESEVLSRIAKFQEGAGRSQLPVKLRSTYSAVVDRLQERWPQTQDTMTTMPTTALDAIDKLLATADPLTRLAGLGLPEPPELFRTCLGDSAGGGANNGTAG